MVDENGALVEASGSLKSVFVILKICCASWKHDHLSEAGVLIHSIAKLKF